MPKGFPQKKALELVPALGFKPGSLTPTQERRVASRLKGATIYEIAKAEGCSISSVADSLKAPSVREYISEVLRDTRIGPGGAPLIEVLLTRLTNLALEAMRPGPRGMMPDNRIRLDATLKLLAYFDHEGNESTSQTSAPGVMQTVTQRALIATERQTTTHT